MKAPGARNTGGKLTRQLGSTTSGRRKDVLQTDQLPEELRHLYQALEAVKKAAPPPHDGHHGLSQAYYMAAESLVRFEQLLDKRPIPADAGVIAADFRSLRELLGLEDGNARVLELVDQAALEAQRVKELLAQRRRRGGRRA